LRAKITVRLNSVHVSRLQLIKEVAYHLPCAIESEFESAPAGQRWELLLPKLRLISLFFLLTLSLRVVHALELGHAVDVTVGAHIVPLASHDEVALQVDEHDEDEQVPQDPWEDANVRRVASWAAELCQTNHVVDSGNQTQLRLDFFLAIVDTESRSRAEHG